MTDKNQSLYPVYLTAEQLQGVRTLLEQVSSREADPDSLIFQILDEVRAARRRSPLFKLLPATVESEAINLAPIQSADSMKANDPNAIPLPPELIAMLGIIPDAVIADLVKALRLNGRVFATLDPNELKVFEFFRRQGRKYGVAATIVSAADPADLAKASSQQHQDEIMRRVNSTVSVVLS